jgi:hypothetical protein
MSVLDVSNSLPPQTADPRVQALHRYWTERRGARRIVGSLNPLRAAQSVP